MRLTSLLLTALSWFLLAELYGGVRPSPIFSSNMVLQQNSNIALRGTADAGEDISVLTSWDNRLKGVRARPDGKWEVNIITPPAGGPYLISFFGNDTIILQDILIGEVWFASGQSNMEMTLLKTKNALEDISSANLSGIRFFNVKRSIDEKPRNEPAVGNGWEICNPETAADLSAIAYFFARKLYSELNVPIGIISSSWGGTPAEAWMNSITLKSDTLFNPIFERWEKWESDVQSDSLLYLTLLGKWEGDSISGLIYSKPESPQSIYMMTRPHRKPSVLFNGMVSPFLKYSIRGVIWFQGTSNKEWYNEYEHLFRTLISSWRNDFNQNVPFYYIQNAPYNYQYPVQADGIREAQLKALDIPGTGMVVTMDCGEKDNLHPGNKKTPGERLALWALANTYDVKGISYSGPLYRDFEIEKSGIRIIFDYAINGLASSDGKELRNFCIADESRLFYPAFAKIEGSSIVVSSPNVDKPVAVRYAFGNVFDANFVNTEGLPASPFRTDTFHLEMTYR
ncbi:MAG: sialate O-acetylesterase [Bacteroidia bacterium]|nr:MAG: sialate O-acetylesterase [Bacteroidia bacterium]